jgi:hypothetical protein
VHRSDQLERDQLEGDQLEEDVHDASHDAPHDAPRCTRKKTTNRKDKFAQVLTYMKESDQQFLEAMQKTNTIFEKLVDKLTSPSQSRQPQDSMELD